MKSAIYILVLAPAAAMAVACGSSQDSPPSTPASSPPASAEASAPNGAESSTDMPHEVVFFDQDSHELDDEARASLDDEAAWMKDNPEEDVVINGYASDIGSASYNFTLANNRANAIREYLVSQGVDIGRISVVSHGPRGPEVAPKIERRAVFASDRE